MATAIENMERALATYRERNKQYGDNYKKFGEWMVKLFPNGLSLRTVHDWNRVGVLIQICSKLSRYAQTPDVGHLDSIHDLGVYAFMLEELDSSLGSTPQKMPDDDRMEQSTCEHVWPDGELFCPNCGHPRPESQGDGFNETPIPPIHRYLCRCGVFGKHICVMGGEGSCISGTCTHPNHVASRSAKYDTI